MMMTLGSIVCGFALDLLLGDPQGWPHPICWIGNLIGYLEKLARRLAGEDSRALLLAGFILVAVVCVLCLYIPFWLLYQAGLISPWLRFALETLMCYQIFATKCLRDESNKVYEALAAGDLSLGRKMLSYIVGRDTMELSEAEVAKGAIETVAENASDGVIAPMLYMFLGGAPLAFLYKGINTMDSMIGYKDPKFLYLGRCAAKLDDIVNFIPARLSAFFMMAAAYFTNLDAPKAWQIFVRDRYNHLSPNSAMTESVAAGALHLQLGGDHYYFGKLVHKETIGDSLKAVEPGDIKRMNTLMYFTAYVGLAVLVLVKALALFIQTY